MIPILNKVHQLAVSKEDIQVFEIIELSDYVDRLENQNRCAAE